MEFKELENCICLINYWGNGDETSIDKMLNRNTDIELQYIVPFTKELNSNVLLVGGNKEKTDVIKHYIFEFSGLNAFYTTHKEILFSQQNDTGNTYTKFEKYVYESHQLFNTLLNEIQICCFKYGIDFFKLCNELHFSLEFIDSGFTLMFEGQEADTTDTKREKRNYIPLAFSFFYKQSVGEIEWFDNWNGGRESAYKEVVSKNYENPAPTAWKQFQREYVKIEREHSTNRWRLCSKENYPAILELLKDSPNALIKAKEELTKSIT